MFSHSYLTLCVCGGGGVLRSTVNDTVLLFLYTRPEGLFCF